MSRLAVELMIDAWAVIRQPLAGDRQGHAHCMTVPCDLSVGWDALMGRYA